MDARAHAVMLFGALVLAGCGGEETTAPTCETTGIRRAAVVSALAFTRENPKGVAPGFNLDGRVSGSDDSETCGKRDFVDESGRQGIDNQLAAMVPDIEEIFGNAVDGLVQGAIDDGQLVILIEMAGVDDFRDDECVDLFVRIGEKTSQTLGTDGVVEAWQTYDPDPAGVVSVARNARIAGGVLETGPFDLAVPIAIFDVTFTLNVYGARFRFAIDEESKLDGHFGGGLVPDEIIEGVKEGDGLEDVLPLVKLAMLANTDLGATPDGSSCARLSSALAFRAVPAFIRANGP